MCRSRYGGNKSGYRRGGSRGRCGRSRTVKTSHKTKYCATSYPKRRSRCSGGANHYYGPVNNNQGHFTPVVNQIRN